MNPEVNIDKTLSQMRKGTLEFCILLIISKDKAYASDILSKLKEVELLVVEGTLYPLLNRLKREGMLDYEWIESFNGPPRKYYFLTENGRTYLDKLKNHWIDFTNSINTLLK